MQFFPAVKMSITIFAMIMQCFFMIAEALVVEVVKGRCEDTPESILASCRRPGVIATSRNIKHLIKALCTKKLPDAYCYGWNDHRCVFVLRSDGTLTPYHENTNNVSSYAFVVGKCPCPEAGEPVKRRSRKRRRKSKLSCTKCC